MEVDISGARVFFTLPFDFPILGKLQISETIVVSWIVMILITGFCIWLTHDLKVENISKRQALAELLVEKGKLQISETIVVSWIVMILITGFCIWLTHDLKVENISKRQALAELLVEKANNFVIGNMGEKFRHFIPFVAALFVTSVVSNLISLIGLRSPTADLSTEAAWAVIVFIMITYQKIKAGGVGGYLKGFTQPIPILTPFNILSELATPISMACRHFGNILSGVVINALLYGALAVASLSLIHI